MDSWTVVSELGLAIKRPTHGVVVYGSAEPLPNPAELLLTQLVAWKHKLSWQFYNYSYGKSFFMSMSKDGVNIPYLFNLEDIIPSDMTLGEVAKNIWRLRQEAAMVCHLSRILVLRATSRPERRWPEKYVKMTVHELHRAGGWLAESGVHYFLRLWAEKDESLIFLCPFQQRGDVYTIYKGMRKLFILTPFLKFTSPARLGLPYWAPTPWGYWLSLPAYYRKRTRRRVKKIINSFFKGCEIRRVEIELP